MIPTIYLKAPFLKIIREHTSRFVVRLEPSVVQLQGRYLYLADGHRKVLVFVTRSYAVPVDRISWEILDSLNYHSRQALQNGLMSLYGRDKIQLVYVLEVVVQRKKSAN